MSKPIEREHTYQNRFRASLWPIVSSIDWLCVKNYLHSWAILAKRWHSHTQQIKLNKHYYSIKTNNKSLWNNGYPLYLPQMRPIIQQKEEPVKNASLMKTYLLNYIRHISDFSSLQV